MVFQIYEWDGHLQGSGNAWSEVANRCKWHWLMATPFGLFGWWLLVKQVLGGPILWRWFCLELVDGCVPGFNELCQWLTLGTAGIPLGAMSKEKGNDWLSCWPEFQVLLPFMVKDEVVWDGNCLLLFVLNGNGFLACNHAWNNLVIVYRGAWNKGLGNLAAQYMKWEIITMKW